MLQVITSVMSFMRDDNAAVEEESGLSPKRAPFDTQALLDGALQTCDAHERHPNTVQLEFDPDAPVPPRLEGDTGRLLWVRMGNCRTAALLARFESAWPGIEQSFASGHRIVLLP